MSELAAIRADEAAVLARIAAGSAPQSRTENFPVALKVLPSAPRTHLMRVYGYARFVDDVGDTAPGDRLRLLDLIERDVLALPTGHAALSPIAALRPTIDECRVPLQPFLDLIEANRLDQRITHYESFDDLLAYCALSAAPVGRIVLGIAGSSTQRNLEDSDLVCNALQVLEHCQDVGEDARAGRVYLPSDDLQAAGVAEGALLGKVTGPAVRQVVALQVERASEMLLAGDGLVRRLPGWARFAVSGFVAGGLATADALRRSDYDVLAQDVRPSRIGTAMRALRLVTRW